MDVAVVVSTGAMAFTSLSCLVGLFSRFYKDNPAQFVGLLLVGLSTGVYAWQIAMTGLPPLVPPMLLSVGLLIFALGTAAKVWRHRKSSDKGS